MVFREGKELFMEDRKREGARNSVSVPSFMKDGKTRQETYIERNISSHNGYKRQYDYEENRPAATGQTPVQRQTAADRQTGASRQTAATRQKTIPKRKSGLWKKLLVGMLIILAVAAGNTAARIQMQVSDVLSGLNRENVLDINEVNVNAAAVTDDKIVNILLVGADKRENWAEAGRSDSVMIATMDLKHKRLKLTSLMRDMYVEIPDHGMDRFNAAYSYGGVELLYRTIAANFGIRMDGYAVVDFEAFKKVINTLGGVEIELTQAEHKYLTTAYKKGSVLKLKQGMNNMNGNQALAYTRIRQDAEGDFGRTRRQRTVLESIFKEVKSLSIGKVTLLAKEIAPEITTDLTDEEIFSYLTSVVMMGTTQIDQLRIPEDNTYTQDRINNKAVLLPDFEINSKALHEFIYEYDGG